MKIMIKAKLFIPIVTLILLSSLSNSFSQEIAITGINEISTIQTVKTNDPQAGIFKLHSSRKTKSDNTAIIEFELGEEASVLLTVYDSEGTLIGTLINDYMYSGDYNVHYKSAEKINAGELTYKLEVKGISGIKNVFAVK